MKYTPLKNNFKNSFAVLFLIYSVFITARLLILDDPRPVSETIPLFHQLTFYFNVCIYAGFVWHLLLANSLLIIGQRSRFMYYGLLLFVFFRLFDEAVVAQAFANYLDTNSSPNDPRDEYSVLIAVGTSVSALLFVSLNVFISKRFFVSKKASDGNLFSDINDKAL